MADVRRRPGCVGPMLVVVLLGACSDSDSQPAGADAALDARVRSGDASGADGATGAAGPEASTMECTPGLLDVTHCLQPDPNCPGGGGYAFATCLPDGTFGPCECMDPVSSEPPSAEETAACLETADQVFTDPCAQCVCADSRDCAVALATCDEDCKNLVYCFAPCVPNAMLDANCIVKCINSAPPGTLTVFGTAIPNCAAHCPDECLTGFLTGPPAPDSDGGAG